MARKYPAPKEQLSLEKMLALPPLPRTFLYEIQKDDDEVVKERMKRREEVAATQKKKEFEKAKQMLRDLALT